MSISGTTINQAKSTANPRPHRMRVNFSLAQLSLQLYDRPFLQQHRPQMQTPPLSTVDECLMDWLRGKQQGSTIRKLPFRAVMEPAQGAEMAMKLSTCLCSQSVGCCMMKYRDTRQPSECPMSVALPAIVALNCMLYQLRQVCVVAHLHSKPVLLAPNRQPETYNDGSLLSKSLMLICTCQSVRNV